VVGDHAGSGLFTAPALKSYAIAGLSSLPEAPSDGNAYGRMNTTWVHVPQSSDLTQPHLNNLVGTGGAMTSSAAPWMNFTGTEAFAMGTSFYLPVVVDFTRTGGTGHRQAFTAQYHVSGAALTEMLVGSAGFAFMTGGSGNLFGFNSYSQAATGTANTAAIISLEADTDCRVNVAQKIGIQVIDVSTSTGDGSNTSAGMIMACQNGGFGWQTGIQFGLDSGTNSRGARTALLRTANATNSATVVRGIDFRTAVFSGPAIDLPAGGTNNGDICWSSGAGGVIRSDTLANGPVLSFQDNVFAVETPPPTGAGLQILQINTSGAPRVTANATIYAANSVLPSTDNVGSLGVNTFRFTSVWAVNGTIQTSDPRLKDDIATLPSMLPVLAAIDPVTFRWKVGGYDMVEDTEEQTVQATETVTEPNPLMPGGTVTREVSLFDEVPLLDADGQPVVEHVPAFAGVTYPDRRASRPATPAADIPRTHRVPRMETKRVPVRKPVAVPGKRTHWGFQAPEIKAAFDALGMDFGGYVKGEDGTESLRPDQLIPVLWRVCQELAAKVEAQEARG
jgi:hypothetical protein